MDRIKVTFVFDARADKTNYMLAVPRVGDIIDFDFRYFKVSKVTWEIELPDEVLVEVKDHY